MNWWRLYHVAMSEFGYTPEQVNAMTPRQVACLASENPPSAPARAKTFAEYEAAIDRAKAGERAWRGE